MHETRSLKFLSTLVLERNKKWNNPETRCQNLVSRDFCCETKNPHFLTPNFAFSSDLKDAYEERLAIAQYDGGQNALQAQRIAYQDAFIAALNALPNDDLENETITDWLDQRIKATRQLITAREIH